MVTHFPLPEKGVSLLKREPAEVSNPPAGRVRLFINLEGRICVKSETGTVTALQDLIDTTNADLADAISALEALIATAEALAKAALPKAGGTMTGTLTLAADPVGNLDAATKQFVSKAIADLINGAPGVLDTLKEISDQLAKDESAASALTTAVAGKLSVSENLGDLDDVAAAQANLALSDLVAAGVAEEGKAAPDSSLPAGRFYVRTNEAGTQPIGLYVGRSPSAPIFFETTGTPADGSVTLAKFAAALIDGAAGVPSLRTLVTTISADNSHAPTAEAVRNADALLLPKAGGTMTGPLTLSGDPTNNLHATTRQYVLAQIAALVNGAPGALDTLKEISDRLEGDEGTVGALTSTVAGKASKGEVTAEKERAEGVEATKLAKGSNLSDLTDAAAARFNLGVGARISALLGQPVATRVASMGHAGGKTLEAEQLSNGVKEGETSKVRHVLVRTAGGIRLVYGNWSKAGEKVPTNTITVKAGVETATGKFIPVYFGGQESVTLQRGAYAVSDVISLDGEAGTAFYSHTYVKVAAGGKWPLDLTTVSADGEGVTTTNVDRSVENVAASNTLCYSPVAIVAVSPTTAVKVIGKVGDSIISGKADTPIDAGWFNRAIGSSFPVVSLSKGGDSAKAFALPNSSQARMQLVDACTHAVVAYGTNDIGAEAETAAEVKANLEAVYKRLALRGIKVYGVTILPLPKSSSDNFATVANQVVSDKKAIFDEVNAWIRETPAPLSGYIEAAWAVESEHGSGKWKAPNYVGPDGTHPLEAGHVAIASAFNPASLFA
jgi:lysophospholipase L1-like esterase